MEKELIKEDSPKENEEKNMYEKMEDLIKKALPKTSEVTKEPTENNNLKTQSNTNTKIYEEFEDLKRQLQEHKKALKETKSLNLLKSSGLDESLKDLITHHPNPQEAVGLLKGFKDKTLKSATSYTPMGAESKKENKLYMFDSIGEK